MMDMCAPALTAPLKNMNPGGSQRPSGVYGTSHDLRPALPHWPGRQGRTLGGRILQSVDPTTIELTLREGMKFHDGQDVTAEDVKFALDYHNQWKAPFFVESLKHLESVETTGKYGVRIKLKDPYAPFIPNLLGAIFIIPKHVWQDIPDKVDVTDPLNYANEKPIGSGPFKFDHWDRGRELKVSAFKEHFSAPKVEGIIRIVLRQP